VVGGSLAEILSLALKEGGQPTLPDRGPLAERLAIPAPG
jgi:hypothetical protein